MGAQVEFSLKLGKSIIFSGVKDHGGVEGRIGVRQWNLKVRSRVLAAK